MSVDTEFAVRKGIRNNPLLREVDSRHRGELHRYMVLVALGVGLLLFSAWQRESVIDRQRQIEELRKSEAEELDLNRQIRLTLETYTAQTRLEERALELGLRQPTLSETIVIERTHASTPAPGVVAQAH